ncbi:MAG: hypothetical protein R2715_23630 [Ilumatobacteraceae bacterium]
MLDGIDGCLELVEQVLARLGSTPSALLTTRGVPTSLRTTTIRLEPSLPRTA